MPSPRRFFARFVLPLIVIAIAVAGVYYVKFRPLPEAVAELRIRRQGSTSLGAESTMAAVDQAAELVQFTATCAQLIRSRSVLRTVLRRDDVKRLKMMREYRDPESWLSDAIEIRQPSPGMLHVVLKCQGMGGKECATLVNAVTDVFLTVVEQKSHAELVEKKKTLQKIHAQLLDEAERERTALETLAQQLGASPPSQSPAVALHPALVRKSVKMIDALAEEIARTRVALLVDQEYERENRAETLQRLEAEYDRQIEEMEQLLADRVNQAQPRRFVTLDLKKRDIERLDRELDRVAQLVFQAELALESRGRIQLISPATAPVGR